MLYRIRNKTITGSIRFSDYHIH